MINLFTDKTTCCGCGACMNICSKSAITMKPDEYGFIYPQIDETKCIECELCKKVCGYQAEMTYPAHNDTYVAVAKDEDILANSASGGVFATLATEVINRGGIVFGCSLEFEDKKLTPKHIMIDNLKDIIKLQGSKYVQSFIGHTYSQVENELNANRLVLFCGTPCQIDGLKHFLQMKEYENLITIDLICHGVPNAQMFEDYICTLETKLKGNLLNFRFRDKFNGWGLNAKATYCKANAKKTACFPCGKSSYYDLFLKSAIYRENCYSCKYANTNRVGDLTIGDYWGIERMHPEYLREMNAEKGVSCMVVNTENGVKAINELCGNMKLYKSNIENVAKENNQLNKPSQMPIDRDVIMGIYKQNGYSAVEKHWKKSEGIKYYLRIIKSKIPATVKVIIKTFKL